MLIFYLYTLPTLSSIETAEDNDTVYNSSLGSNSSINGGAGNDSISNVGDKVTINGGAGNDTFLYSKGDGKDVIYGFDDKDTLTLDNLTFKASYKDKVVTLTFDDGGSIKFKDFTATTFHIDNNTYQLNSKNKFVKK